MPQSFKKQTASKNNVNPSIQEDYNMKINKKNITINTLIILLIACSLSIFYYLEVYSKEKVIITLANIHGYNSITELEESADLVIIGTPTTNFKNRKHVVKHYKSGHIEDFYTYTDIKIYDVLKQEGSNYNKDDILEVIEPISIQQTFHGKYKFQFESYNELEQGKQYVLYLKENDFSEYSIMSLGYGKYSLDVNDSNDEIDLHNRQQIKTDVINKYGK